MKICIHCKRKKACGYVEYRRDKKKKRYWYCLYCYENYGKYPDNYKKYEIK